MKTTTLALAALLLLLAPAAAAEKGDLVATAVADGRFTTLARALSAADLVDDLRGAGPFTVFAPTDAAFAALPAGALSGLLEDKDALRRVLLNHVAAGRVLARDLLPVGSATTLGGTRLPLGLRVGKANVTQADVVCSNGVIHVIDRVLIATLDTAATKTKEQPLKTAQPMATRMDPVKAIHAAIDRGAPLFNDGHIEKCAQVYHDTAAKLLRDDRALGAWDRMQLGMALRKPHKDASEQAWNLRHAFDAILANMSFEPRMEASLPKGFPKPGPVGRIVEKRYPVYRAARASGGNMAFWTLFSHIKKNKVEMTAPVEMTMDQRMRPRDMAFLYERPDQGAAGKQGRVDVLDLKPLTVLSIGMRGRRSSADMELAKSLLEAHMQAEGWQRDGDFRALGYNSPMVPADKQFWEFQVPVRR